MQGDWRNSVAQAISWNDSKKERKGKVLSLLVASAISVAVMSPGMRTSMAESGDQMLSVIVRALPGGANEAAQAVEQAGGEIGMKLRILHGFAAEVPASSMESLSGMPEVLAITPDHRIAMMQTLTDPLTDPLATTTEPILEPSPTATTEPTTTTEPVPVYDPTIDNGSMYSTVRAIRAKDYWKKGFTGKGVDVALIDTGVVPVPGMDDPAKVLNGADLSFESNVEEVRYLDTYGHGTHMAGIIAGRDAGIPAGTEHSDLETRFMGVAPDARIVNVKVADYEGVVDVSQVIAAIDWVVQHRNDPGMNIRVLNMSFGTDGVQDYVRDPLAFAAEQAWHKGIVVVAAAGNAGYAPQQLSNPAYDPYLIAVGADKPGGFGTTNDDIIPDFSSFGNIARKPDFVAPGQSLQSLTATGSYIHDNHPEGVISGTEARFFRGSGTSQAAAVVSGAAALIIQQRPNITPDQVKALLSSTAVKLPAADPVQQGAGLINMRSALTTATPASVQLHTRSTGMGSLDAARGSVRITDEETGEQLTGELDIFGNPWDPYTYTTNSLTGKSWSGGFYNGVEYTGGDWSGKSWSGKSWSGKSWSGKSWSGKSWSSDVWEGKSWSGKSWSGKSWSGKSWSGKSWSGKSWSGKSWSGKSWSSFSYE